MVMISLNGSALIECQCCGGITPVSVIVRNHVLLASTTTCGDENCIALARSVRR